MKIHRIVLLLIIVLTSLASDARMLRVVRIADSRTIVVENGIHITLAGVTITDVEGARTFLLWTLGDAWITGEPRTGGYLVWRSPDGLFVNRELVARGFATATTIEVAPPRTVRVTYLGQLEPGGPPPSRTAGANLKTEPGTGSAQAARPRARRSPRGRRILVVPAKK